MDVSFRKDACSGPLPKIAIVAFRNRLRILATRFRSLDDDGLSRIERSSHKRAAVHKQSWLFQSIEAPARIGKPIEDQAESIAQPCTLNLNVVVIV